ncbi:hypothetical protein BD779DRAFT_1520396 [Infundibulicybe gibba]|nr:hypothetical protein BD779DRAFT_1520396 [Infundibulicybe gibba]
MEVPRIPAYPSAQARKNLSPSRLATLNQDIARALAYTLSLSDSKLSTQPAHVFLASYLKHTAHQHLQSLIWEHSTPPQRSKIETLISQHTLSLAKRVGPSLGVQTLLDLQSCTRPPCIHVRSIFSSTKILTPAQGLYALLAPQPLLLDFAHSKPFLLSLATTYDEGLASVARSYGGLPASTKVALLDSFHSLSVLYYFLSPRAQDLPRHESEYTFSLMFSLLEISPPQNSSHTQIPTPFLNLPLLTDYHHAYNLSHTLARSLSSAEEKDARLDILESSLGSTEHSDPGPQISSQGLRSSSEDEIDIQIIQILDILPDQDPSYLRALLQHPVHGGSVEHVVEGLLDQWESVNNRRNIFDGDEMDLERVRFGKDQSEPSTAQDKEFMEQVKATILRRAEEMVYEDTTSEEETEDEVDGQEKGRARARVLAYEDEETGDGVKVLGDGSSESAGEDDGDDEDSTEKPSLETTLELAYIRDPTLFQRDGVTRRSAGRAELRRVTGAFSQHIVALGLTFSRPKKDRILGKHEFSGNQPAAPIEQPVASSSSRGRGRGGRGGRGRGRGRGGGDGGGEGGDARERAWKDKNKASRGNHGRKRGHDKKMARAGGPS